MSKEKKYKYIKNGTIEGVELVTMPIYQFISEHPISQTVMIEKPDGHFEYQKVYSRSGLIYKFKETDTITIKRPSRNEWLEIQQANKDGFEYSDVKMLGIKINNEDIDDDYFGNLLSPSEYGELNSVISNFILGLKVKKIV